MADPYARMTVWDMLAWFFLGKHRRRQEEIADEVARGVIDSWKYLDFNSLDTTQFAFVDTALPKIQKGFEDSQVATSDFLQEYRKLYFASKAIVAPPREPYVPVRQLTAAPEIDPERLFPAPGVLTAPEPQRQLEGRPAPAFDTQRAAAHILSAGPGGVKRSMPAPEDVAMAKGRDAAVGAAVRNAMDGGRQISVTEADEDNYAIGWQRVTDENPCYFCALLAANGPYYTNRNAFRRSNKKYDPNIAFAATGEPDGIAKVHNHCRCTLVVCFEEFTQQDPWGKVALRLWNKVAGEGLSGREALNEYRFLYNENLKTDNPVTGANIDSLTVRNKIDRTLRGIRSDSPAADYLRNVADDLRRSA